MSAITGKQLAELIASALGLDLDGVRVLKITCEPDEAALIEVEKYVSGEAGDRVATILKHYELLEKPGPIRETTASSDYAKHYSR
jgi:hypothetical protein